MTMTTLKLFIYNQAVELNLLTLFSYLEILSKKMLKYLETEILIVKEKVITQRNSTNAWNVNNNGNVNNNNKSNSYFVVPI